MRILRGLASSENAGSVTGHSVCLAPPGTDLVLRHSRSVFLYFNPAVTPDRQATEDYRLTPSESTPDLLFTESPLRGPTLGGPRRFVSRHARSGPMQTTPSTFSRSTDPILTESRARGPCPQIPERLVVPQAPSRPLNRSRQRGGATGAPYRNLNFNYRKSIRCSQRGANCFASPVYGTPTCVNAMPSIATSDMQWRRVCRDGRLDSAVGRFCSELGTPAVGTHRATSNLNLV